MDLIEFIDRRRRSKEPTEESPQSYSWCIYSYSFVRLTSTISFILETYTGARFYIGGVTIIGLLVPSNDPRLSLISGHGTAAASPFVIAINHAGIKALPSIINAALLTSGN
jgi:amino acid permease